MERNKSGVQQPNTFWTQCPFCSWKLQYNRDILDCLINCHKCRQAFEAHELKTDVHNETLKPSPSPNKSGVQQPNTFWTQCPFCFSKLQYYRDILDCFLNCHICQQAFDAHELKTDVHNETLRPSPSPTKAGNNFIDLSHSDDEVRVLGKRKRPETLNAASSFVCETCLETKPVVESFGIKNCCHVYCTDCVVKYVDFKLQQNVTNIGCLVPNCQGSLDPEYCHSILKPEVFEKWGRMLFEAEIVGSQKFYCPFKDCSAMLIDDGGEVVRESECPNCNRMFCAQCVVPWHTGIACEEHKRLIKKEEIMMEKLAYKNHWRKCPTCGIYVEKLGGCTSVRCRCGTLFSHYCGRQGCTFCVDEEYRRKYQRMKNRLSMGYYVFEEEFMKIQLEREEPYDRPTVMKLGREKWMSMSRSERRPYENPEMKPARLLNVGPPMEPDRRLREKKAKG